MTSSFTPTAGNLVSREIRLTGRPVGEPTLDLFTLAERVLPAPAEGQVLVRNTWMSVDPYHRNLMNAGSPTSYAVGAPLHGFAVGEVVASAAPAVPVGATVVHPLGWREYALADADTARIVDPTTAPPSAYLGVLGLTGLSAYVTLTHTTPVRDGDVVFVSAAAGAVGSVAGQLARLLGASRVIGSAGGPVKVKKLIEDFGFDAAIDYREGDLAERLARAAPEGIDLYVDNVGGDHLAAALPAMNLGGQIALVGAISSYNATEPPPGSPNLFQAIPKELTLRGMSVSEHFGQLPAYQDRAVQWLASGALREEQTVYDGLERAPEALLGVLRGANIGKSLVRLSPDP